MVHRLRVACFSVFFLLISFVMCARAFAAGIEGEWAILDHKTKRPSAIVNIYQVPGTSSYEGVLVRAFDSVGGQLVKTCQGCTGVYYKAKIKGLKLIKRLVLRNGRYRNGRILDPRNGSWYKITCQLVEGGSRLKVRGYILLPLFGQTETFVRNA